MKKKKMHMIGNAHIDPVWLWQWEEGFAEVKATFRSALDRMNEYDDYFFTCSSSVFYEWIESNNPKMFEEIKKMVKEGRWNIVGGWYLQPDCNIPSGESYVRQALYGQRYFKEKFDVIAKIGYNVDSFGHNANLPQILKKSGLDYYVFMRPMPLEMGLPGRIFNWESDDGSKVLAYRIPYEYCTWGKELENHINRTIDEFSGYVDELMCFYGVGNHGGGPTKKNIESIHKIAKENSDIDIVMSTPDKYFESIKKKSCKYPTVHTELQHHSSGCYSVHSEVKRYNRKSENSLLRAEKFSVISEKLCAQKYPLDFSRAWKNVLFNQFHDILAGTSIEPAYMDARNLYGEALSIANRNENYALQAISWDICIEENEKMKPIVVFNPRSWEDNMVVEKEIGKITKNHILTDEVGSEVPYQLTRSHATCRGRNRICFMAKLPPYGYRVYKLVEKDECQKAEKTKRSKEYLLENNRFKLEISKETGYIKSLYDKENDVEIFKNDAASLKVIEDKSDTWSHSVFTFNKIIGEFKVSSIKTIEAGDVREIIQVKYVYRDSKVTQEFKMYNGYEQIDVDVRIDWREKQKMLKLKFPVNLKFRKASSEIPYGYIERNAKGLEEPGQGWIDFSGQAENKNLLYGIGITNDSKYSFDFTVDEIGLTLLRSPVYAHHDPAKLEEEVDYTYIDQGIQNVSYSIIPHVGGVEKSEIVKRQAILNQPPISIVETYHKGNLPQKGSFISIDKENIIATVLKKSEDYKSYILRCFETSKKNCEVTISLPLWEREIKTSFGPGEIKTFKIPNNLDEKINEINLIELED